MTRVAVIQSSSVPFNAEATTQKTVDLIRQCAQEGAELAVFPETFLGTYPKGLTFGSPVGHRTDEGRDEYQRYVDGAVELQGAEMTVIAEAAAQHGVFVALGIVEKLGSTLYCTAAMVDPQVGLVGHHRKVMPTGAERLVWGFGDGSTLPVVDSPAGRIGTVICWENYMPLMRQAMYSQGIEIYVAPTADDRQSWQHTMTHIAIEGRCFVLAACQYIKRSAYPDDYAPAFGKDPDDILMHGGSVIIDPFGTTLAGPVFDDEAILYAELNLAAKTRSHLDLDVVGHYARPDIFQLHVDGARKDSVTFKR